MRATKTTLQRCRSAIQASRTNGKTASLPAFLGQKEKQHTGQAPLQCSGAYARYFKFAPDMN